MMSGKTFTVEALKAEAAVFAKAEGRHSEPSLFGVTDGKAVGTYLEKKFREYLMARYSIVVGSCANGIDFPDINVDMKATSETQPQSSCPFKSARQKVFGLGYSLLVLVYRKIDDHESRTATLEIVHTLFIEARATADYTLTAHLRDMIEDGAIEDDIAAYLSDRNLPADEIELRHFAKELLKTPPEQGYLTISNALQWRLQYGHAIREAGSTPSVLKL